MATIIWPPLVPLEFDSRDSDSVPDAEQSSENEELLQKELARSLAAELSWFLEYLFDRTLKLMKEGLGECVVLLEPDEPGSTLALSTVKSEILKGYITRVGTRVVKGGGTISLCLRSALQDIKLKLPSSNPFREFDIHTFSISQSPTAPVLQLLTLANLRTNVNAALDAVDATVWTGSKTDANYIAAQLKLLSDCLQGAQHCLRDGSEDESRKAKSWWEDSVPTDVFDPPLADNISFHFSLHESALVLTVRILDLLTEAEAHQTTNPSLFRTILSTPQSVLRSLTHTHNQQHGHSQNHTCPASSASSTIEPASSQRSDAVSIPGAHLSVPTESHTASHWGSWLGSASVSKSTTSTSQHLRPPPPAPSSSHASEGNGMGGAAAAAANNHSSHGRIASSTNTKNTDSSSNSNSNSLSSASSSSLNHRPAPIPFPFFRGHYARVRDTVTVETFDPKLMAVWTKLTHLEGNLAAARRNLGVLMGRLDEDDLELDFP